MKQGEWHRSCQHKSYRLTCADYEALVAEAGNRCQICGTPGPSTWRRKLVIDHDHEVGQWAVRGLLCPPCNTTLPEGRTPAAEQAAYLAAPWYARFVQPLTLPEPDDGAGVSDGINGLWERSGDLWFPRKGYYREPRTWQWLLHMFGPHRIRIPKEQA
ncbi:endonuclease domain-containing protein [Streptomyces sp. LUP30]|uniref:endonuclease domain-containing protein n=1 Tax=Streptomyces sp. LUP30 TaxID=1890285 RepID=UPI00159F1D26|nr:endonuclease domain-containing protein [Streptomyces sp. LUP30]